MKLKNNFKLIEYNVINFISRQTKLFFVNCHKFFSKIKDHY